MADVTELLEKAEKKVAAGTRICPFPGLRPFTSSETYLYFGQDTVSQRVLNQLSEHRFVAILGGAGVGKTSFIHCGLTPYFNSGMVGSTRTNWHIIQIRPLNDPLHNLAVALNGDNNPVQAHIYCNVLKRGKSGLIEIFKNQSPGPQDKYLIVVDQFEDLFRSKKLKNESGLSEDVYQFVNILTHSVQQKELPVYLAMVVRSDFADDCLKFPYLANLINRSNVLIPRLTRDQLREVVTGPLEASHLKYDTSLLVQVLNDASNLDDILPRLQHAMKRTWESWKNLGTPEIPFSLTEYEIAGGLKNAINNHANGLFQKLTDYEKVLCEKIFKSLAEKVSENKGFTRPSTVKELSDIARADIGDVTRIINIFRDPSAGFLLPSEGSLSPDTVIDLVHSSLLRTWSRLNSWVQDENISSQMYCQLAEASAQYQTGKIGLLRPPDLQIALNWQEKQKPALEWAKRYNPAFERAMVYLRTSHETYNAEENFKKLQAKKALKRVRSLTVILGSTAILALVLTVYSQVMRHQDIERLKKASEQQAQLQRKSFEAERESQEYLMEKRLAEIAALEAMKLKEDAVTETKVLSKQKNQAELTAQEVIQENTKYQENLQQVTLQKQLAEKNAQREAENRSVAEKEKEETFKRRMQNLGQTLAMKSLQTNNNVNLKSLLALHSFVFNSKFGSSLTNPDVYNALYESVNETGGTTRYGLKGHAGAVRAFCGQSGTNVVFSTGVDGRVLRWVITDEVRSPQTVFQTSSGNASMKISASGRFLAVGSETGTIYLLDLSNPTTPVQLRGHQGVVFSLVFTPDGQQLISSGGDKKILLWDLEKRSNTVIYQSQANVRAIAISPDGKFLAGGSDDGRTFMWDIRGNEFLNLPDEDKTAIHAVTFSPNGLTLVTGDLTGRLEFWNPYSQKLIRTLKPHSGRVTQIVFSPSGEMVASSSYDKTVAIYDARFINTNVVILREKALIFSIIFTNDNRRIITAPNSAEFVGVWPSQSRVLAEQLCSKVSRALTQDEWNSFIGSDIKYEKPCE